MPDRFSRPVHVIDTDLNSTRARQVDARRQLVELRRRMAELEHQELQLLAAVDARGRRYDQLLDERLRSVATTTAVPAT